MILFLKGDCWGGDSQKERGKAEGYMGAYD
jgi:hypothetical protein